MDQNKLENILDLVVEFAAANNEIQAVGLCGSWARDMANPESDIDLSIICINKESFKNGGWLKDIHFKKIDEWIIRFEDKNYGRVWSRHVFLGSGAEIEFSFSDSSWADIDPVDKGTKKVVSDGYRILYDPHQILNRLKEHVNSNP